jgi:hypothetical protein
MGHQNFISVTNANDGNAVTVLVQYYNDEMSMVLYYLRVIPGGGNLLVDPFDHEIPGTATLDGDDMEIPGTATNVSGVIDTLPAMTNDDDGAGVNSGRFVIVVTAVGANVGVDHSGDGKIGDVILTAGQSSSATDTTTVGGYRIDDAGQIILIARDSDPSTTDPPGDPDIEYRVLANAEGAAAQYVAEMSRAETVNVLFPAFLAAGMHGVDNIDNGGTLSLIGMGLNLTNKDQIKTDPDDDGILEDVSTKNVGNLSVSNAMPIAFNHLTGHFTEALSETAAGGSDQTASWGGTPIVRPAVGNTANGMVRVSNAAAANADPARMFYMIGDYYPLNGMDSMPVVETSDQGWVSLATYNARVADPDDTTLDALINAPAEDTPATDFDNDDVVGFRGGRLAEKDAGGAEVANVVTKGAARLGYGAPSTIKDGPVMNRGLSGGALVLPALHGGGAATQQIMLFLSAADTFGGAGGYKLVKALTKYAVTVHDNMGDVLPNPADDRVFGGSGGPEIAGTSIIVEGIRVTTDAGACGGDEENMLGGYWTLADLTGLVPTVSSGAKKFDGLDAMLDSAKNASPGFIKFMRAGLKCSKDYGDGNNDDGNTTPAKDERTYEGGTLIVEKASTDRAFVTTGEALLKFITPSATFAASWSLKSPPSPAN